MSSSKSWRQRLPGIASAVGAACVFILFALYAFDQIPGPFEETDQHASAMAGDDEEHADHGHDHAGHAHESVNASIQLTSQARMNMRLQVEPVSVGTYTDYIEVPGVMSEWPGRTHYSVTSPLTGVLNSIGVSRGELVESGSPLFTLRLTHQDLVEAQESFLAKLGELDVENREIERLSSIASSGAVAGKTLITRRYERDKLLSSIEAARQAMLLHGLTKQQIERIEQSRELIREVTVYAPVLHADRSLHHDSIGHDHEASEASGVSGAAIETGLDENFVSLVQPPSIDSHPAHLENDFLVTELNVQPGQSVTAGQELARLSDYAQLLIEGHAYQRDGDVLKRVADTGADVQAVMESSQQRRRIVSGLHIAYIGAEIGRESRALPFYVPVDNEIERRDQRGNKQYISWRYKPGQRLTLRLPVQQIDEAIVVPKDAVAEEGNERYVFVENGSLFERVPVVVLARDSVHIAIRNDGQLWPGQSIAVKGAHQLQMALRNESGGAIDPHAGHNH